MRPRLKSLEDQAIVITGASSGIGLATARLAAARGARVLLAARSLDGLWDAAERIRQQGGDVASVVADVASEHDVRRVAETAAHRFGGIDTWINNAGVSVYGRSDQVPIEDQRRVFDTNYWGTVNGCRVALEYLSHRGARSSTSAACCPSAPFPCRRPIRPPSTRSRASPTPSGWS